MSNKPNKTYRPSSNVQAARSSGSSNRTWWIVGAVVLVVVVALGVALAIGGKDDTKGGGESASGGTVVPSGETSVGTVEVTGAPLPEFDASISPDPAAGMAAPGLTGQSFDGQTVAIANDGKPKVVMFLAHWCPHCQAEVPRLVDWLEANGMPADVELYAVTTGTSPDKPNYPPGAWLRGKHWPVTTMVDNTDQSAALAYGLTSYPYFVVVDANGNVVMRTSGEITMDQWAELLAAARGEGATTAGTAGDLSSPAN